MMPTGTSLSFLKKAGHEKYIVRVRYLKLMTVDAKHMRLPLIPLLGRSEKCHPTSDIADKQRLADNW